MTTLRDRMLETGMLELGDFRFADGSRSNNHLSSERLFEHPLVLTAVMHNLGRLALSYDPDLLVGIPSGGERFARELAKPRHTNLPIAFLTKEKDEPGLKTYTIAEADEAHDFVDSDELIANAERIVLIEDIFSRFTSTRGALAVPKLENKVVAAVAAWDRGAHPARIGISVPHEALVTEYIPKQLRQGEELYLRGVPAKTVAQ